MERLTTTPFGARPIPAALMSDVLAPQDPPEGVNGDKWALLADLRDARGAFGVTDRDLAVLDALLSFHPRRDLAEGDGPIVFPSNASLSARAHGMAESTLRRHLAALVGAGLIRRHDSPTGKRYAARAADGTILRAFGFDFAPLLVRRAEIAEAAEAARARAEALGRLREAVSLSLRDARKLARFGAEDEGGPVWEALERRAEAARRTLRRRLPAEALEAVRREVDALLAAVRSRLARSCPSEIPSAGAAHSGRRLQNSNTDLSDLELRRETAKAADAAPGSGRAVREAGEPSIPLGLVLRACPSLDTFAPEPVRSWEELVSAADALRGMMGVSPDAWQAAKRAMGPAAAAAALACILERGVEIASPGGYLRALTAKAAAGAFSVAPMVLAALGRAEGRAA